MRQIVLDTETTGLEPEEGHRVIEIGCVELVDRRLTGNNFHLYLNPGRDVDQAALEVHALDSDFLADKPGFEQIAAEFLDYIRDSELVIHNAPFDVGFLDAELARLDGYGVTRDYASVRDTLLLARNKHPGQKNNLDALCRRYGVENAHRELHGALLDAEILAEVYLLMTGGQTRLSLGGAETEGEEGTETVRPLPSDRAPLRVIRASDAEEQAHRAKLADLAEAAGSDPLWARRTP